MRDFLALKSSDGLLNALRSAKDRKPSADELFEQRVSFVFSAMGPQNGATREQVRQAILDQGGRTSSEASR